LGPLFSPLQVVASKKKGSRGENLARRSSWEEKGLRGTTRRKALGIGGGFREKGTPALGGAGGAPFWREVLREKKVARGTPLGGHSFLKEGTGVPSDEDARGHGGH